MLKIDSDLEGVMAIHQDREAMLTSNSRLYHEKTSIVQITFDNFYKENINFQCF